MTELAAKLLPEMARGTAIGKRDFSNDGLEQEFKFFSWLEGGLCTTCAPGDQEKLITGSVSMPGSRRGEPQFRLPALRLSISIKHRHAHPEVPLSLARG